MSTRRRIGVSTATTEAARRQLMQPVPCWEKVWVTPQDVPSGSTLKVYRWIKTDKKQTFSDEEGEVDEPLAPLPDEPEVEEDLDQDDRATSVGQGASASRAVSEPVAPTDVEDTPAPQRSKPHPLSMSLVPGSPTPPPNGNEEPEPAENAELTDLKPMETTSMDVTEGDLVVPEATEVGDSSLLNQLEVPLELEGGETVDIVDLDVDMAQLGPDGTRFEGAADLSQLQETDAILGGEVLDQSIDPFAEEQ